MSNFRLSLLSGGKPIDKKKYISWLWGFIVIETLAAGGFIFRLYERIDQLESQISTRTKRE